MHGLTSDEKLSKTCGNSEKPLTSFCINNYNGTLFGGLNLDGFWSIHSCQNVTYYIGNNMYGHKHLPVYLNYKYSWSGRYPIIFPDIDSNNASYIYKISLATMDSLDPNRLVVQRDDAQINKYADSSFKYNAMANEFWHSKYNGYRQQNETFL